MQIKTTMRYHFTYVVKAITKKNTKKQKKGKITSIGKDVEKLVSPRTSGETVKWYSCSGRHFGSFSES